MTVLFLLSAAAVGLGCAAALAFALRGAGAPTGVARALQLIDQHGQPKDYARQDSAAADRLVKPVFAATHRLARSLVPSGEAQRIGHRLDVAGNPALWTVERILAVKGAGMLVAGLLGLVFAGLSPKGMLFVAAGAALGFYAPDIALVNAGQKRQEELRRGFAEALDMLTVCVEAGQGFDGALRQVAQSVTGPVGGEFSRVLQEIQIGKPRGEAFQSLSTRTSVGEVKTFVSALIQADRLGLPLGQVLREQAQQMRLVRRQRAEEKAQKVTVKILFPLLFCIFPTLMIVVMGPGIIRMIPVLGSF
ncbi:MAG TPA: type II secretion system F family protein [Dermatophilaceae bacterium]|nr:type II secretion system F family protein [Dermatophilaceae bacterium]